MKRKVAHYWYALADQIIVHVEARRVFVRNQNGEHLRSPVTGKREPHPGDGTDMLDWSYETLGLYYGLPMPDTGWDGDC